MAEMPTRAESLTSQILQISKPTPQSCGPLPSSHRLHRPASDSQSIWRGGGDYVLDFLVSFVVCRPNLSPSSSSSGTSGGTNGETGSTSDLGEFMSKSWCWGGRDAGTTGISMLALPDMACSGLSHVTRHTSHVTCHTSHVTHHTSHVTRYLPPGTPGQPLRPLTRGRLCRQRYRYHHEDDESSVTGCKMPHKVSLERYH